MILYYLLIFFFESWSELICLIVLFLMSLIISFNKLLKCLSFALSVTESLKIVVRSYSPWVSSVAFLYMLHSPGVVACASSVLEKSVCFVRESLTNSLFSNDPSPVPVSGHRGESKH